MWTCATSLTCTAQHHLCLFFLSARRENRLFTVLSGADSCAMRSPCVALLSVVMGGRGGAALDL
jgi:hypothetical protein